MRLSILMPVYNEVRTVRRAIGDVLDAELPVEWELIVVDDGSTDGTREVLRRFGEGADVHVLYHARNLGKGVAIRTALEAAEGEFSAIFDADLEYSASDLARMSQPLIEGKSNAVFGVRAFDGHSSHSFWYVVGNRLVTLAANVLFNVYFGDLMCCHKAVRTTLLRSLGCREAGFAIEAEIGARLVQTRERVFEIPVEYTARLTEEGKKLRPSDGLRVLLTLLRCRLTPAAAT
jgi:glycosyltransferase involved in cell wall biosynthesis